MDLVFAPLSVFSEREAVVDFITAFHLEYSAFVYKPPDPEKLRVYLLIMPFSVSNVMPEISSISQNIEYVP